MMNGFAVVADLNARDANEVSYPTLDSANDDGGVVSCSVMGPDWTLWGSYGRDSDSS